MNNAYAVCSFGHLKCVTNDLIKALYQCDLNSEIFFQTNIMGFPVSIYSYNEFNKDEFPMFITTVDTNTLEELLEEINGELRPILVKELNKRRIEQI
jgi:hypothetical protein